MYCSSFLRFNCVFQKVDCAFKRVFLIKNLFLNEKAFASRLCEYFRYCTHGLKLSVSFLCWTTYLSLNFFLNSPHSIRLSRFSSTFTPFLQLSPVIKRFKSTSIAMLLYVTQKRYREGNSSPRGTFYARSHFMNNFTRPWFRYGDELFFSFSIPLFFIFFRIAPFYLFRFIPVPAYKLSFVLLVSHYIKTVSASSAWFHSPLVLYFSAKRTFTLFIQTHPY